MTKHKHIEIFGDLRFYNKKVELPKGITNIGNLYNYRLLSTHPNSAIQSEEAGCEFYENEFKPCPFCTGEAELGVERYGISNVKCLDCGAKFIGFYDSSDISNLLNSWNKREV